MTSFTMKTQKENEQEGRKMIGVLSQAFYSRDVTTRCIPRRCVLAVFSCEIFMKNDEK